MFVNNKSKNDKNRNPNYYKKDRKHFDNSFMYKSILVYKYILNFYISTLHVHSPFYLILNRGLAETKWNLSQKWTLWKMSSYSIGLVIPRPIRSIVAGHQARNSTMSLDANIGLSSVVILPLPLLIDVHEVGQ
jgi:hypothetical protein